MKPGKPIDDRRLFFRYLARETVVFVEELGGNRHVKFGDLFKLPPEAIAALIPRICPGVQILPEKDRVLARLPGANEAVALFRTEEANLAVFNRFNGEKTIGQVASEVGAVMGWPEERSMEHVKRLFFHLVVLRVSVPANPVSPEELSPGS